MEFSPKIQNLIDTSGQDVATTRSAQLNAYVERLNAPSSTQAPLSFGQLLTQTKQANPDFGLPQILAKQANMPKAKNLNNVQNTNPYGYVANVSNHNINSEKAYILNIISQVSKKYDIDENLVKAVINQESAFKADAVSKAGAQGLMQLMPATAKEMGVTDPMNPLQNIEGGVKYLKGLLNRYKGNLVLALAAYNAGGGNVDKYDGVPPFKETQNYVKSILRNYLR